MGKKVPEPGKDRLGAGPGGVDPEEISSGTAEEESGPRIGPADAEYRDRPQGQKRHTEKKLKKHRMGRLQRMQCAADEACGETDPHAPQQRNEDNLGLCHRKTPRCCRGCS